MKVFSEFQQPQQTTSYKYASLLRRLYLGSVYFTDNILAATDRLELLCWHDVIPRKRSLCQENAILLVV